MADTKITDLTALTGASVASTDQLVIVDVSDTTMASSGTDKKITATELATAITALGSLATDAEVAAGYQPLDSDLTAIAALTTTATGRSVLAAADAAAIRTIAGVGTIGTQASSSVSITGGSITGITDLAVADGGTGASTAADARTNLGLVIGTNVQAQDAELAAIAGLTSAADRVPYFTGSGTASLATFTAAGRNLVDDADTTAQRTTLGLGTAATADSGAAAGNVLAVNTVNAKGDLLVATADNTIGVLTVGTNTHVLTADSSQATGVKWAAASGGSVIGDMGQIWPNTTDPFSIRYGGASVTTQTDAVTFSPFTALRACVLSTVSVHSSAATASSTVGIALYRSGTDGRPGTLDTDFGTVDTSSTGKKTISALSVSIAAGELVWLATVGGATPGLCYGVAGTTSGGYGSVNPIAMRGSLSDNAARSGFYYAATTSSAFPTTPTVLFSVVNAGDMLNIEWTFSSVS